MACDWVDVKKPLAEGGALGWALGTSRTYDKPCQGSIPNCSFIAALSSIAWVWPYLLNKISPSGATSYNYQVLFYPEPHPNRIANVIHVTPELVYDDVISGLCWGRVREPSTEFWVGIYEKAYAGFVENWPNTESAPIPGPAEWNFDGSDINWGGNSSKIMSYITNKRWNNRLNSGKTADQVWNELLAKCPSSNNNKVMNPMVAWTYTTAPAGYSYDDDLVRGNHTYSLLGILAGDSGAKYVVLREPCGSIVDTPATGSLSSWNGINLNGVTGVYGITHTDFQAKFEGYGWI